MDDEALPPTAGDISPAWEDVFIVLGVLVLVTLAVLLWALIFSARGRRHRHRHHHHHHKNYREELKKTAGGIKEMIQQRQHHHRHDHHPRNPTLAETGGLPPIRGEKPPPPAQP